MRSIEMCLHVSLNFLVNLAYYKVSKVNNVWCVHVTMPGCANMQGSSGAMEEVE